MKQNELVTAKYKTPDGIALRHIGEIFLLVPYRNVSQIRCDQFMATNYVGAMIWQACETPSSVQDIVNMMKEDFNVPESELRNDTVNIVNLFKEYGLLVEVK